MEIIDKTQFLSDGRRWRVSDGYKGSWCRPVTCLQMPAMALAGAVKKVTMGKKSVWYVDAESVGERIQARRERVRRWRGQREISSHT